MFLCLVRLHDESNCDCLLCSMMSLMFHLHAPDKVIILVVFESMVLIR